MDTYNGQHFQLSWITSEIKEETNEWAKGFGKYLAVQSDDIPDDGITIPSLTAKPMTTSQLRRFFGEIKRIENDFDKNRNDVIMLQPMLAYASGRDRDDKTKRNKTRIGVFVEQITPAIAEIKPSNEGAEKRFKNFVKVFEAIVAYHKFYGGKES